MLVLTVWLIYNDRERRDDKIDLFRGEQATDQLRITFAPGDSASRSIYRFKFSREEARRYLANVVGSLRFDQDPAEKIQISAVTAPPVMYHVTDLEDAEEPIMSLVDQVLYTDITHDYD